MKRILSVLLVAILALIPLSSCLAVSAADTVVYIKNTGADSANGTTAETAVATFQRAYELLASGGTLVVCGETTIAADFNAPANKGAVTITSNYGGVDYRSTASAQLIFMGSLYLNGETVLKDMNIFVGVTNKAIACNSNKVVIDTGISCANEVNVQNLSIVGGAFSVETTQSDDSKPVDLTINSGSWRVVRAGNRSQKSHEINGDIRLTINGGDFTSYIVGGSATNTNGNVYVTINGGMFSQKISASYKSTEAIGTVNGNAELTINGGTFFETIDLCMGKEAKVTGTGKLTVTGGNFDNAGTISGINCAGGSTVDYSGFAGFKADKLSGFDTVIAATAAPVTTAAPVVTTAAPAVTTAAPVVTTAAPVAETSAPLTADYTAVIAVLALLATAAVIMLSVMKRGKQSNR